MHWNGASKVEAEAQKALKRRELLNKWADNLVKAAQSGALGGQPVQLYRVELLAGPRVAGLWINAGLATGKLLRLLSADESALVRQFIPWEFPGEPAIYMSERYIAIEVGWPKGLAEEVIPLSTLPQRVKRSGYFVAGKNAIGQTIVLGLDDRHPHFLIAGATGSGKSNALKCAVVQLAQQGHSIILLDGKWGEGLGELKRLRGLVGPLATESNEIRNALGWAYREMRERYEKPVLRERKLVIVFDEFQEYTGPQGDPLITELLRSLVARGRAAGIHLLLATQHPSIRTFGDPSIRRNLSGRIALRVEDSKTSEIVVGAPQPRADRLLGLGDSYCIVPGLFYRTQIALVTRGDIAKASDGGPQMESWPEFRAEEISGQLPREPGRPQEFFTPEELALALEAASEGRGRPGFIQMLREAGCSMGTERALRLMKLGREILRVLRKHHWDLCLSENYGSEGEGKDLWELEVDTENLRTVRQEDGDEES